MRRRGEPNSATNGAGGRPDGRRMSAATWAVQPLVAVLYAGAAQLGLALAVGNANVTAVWPPTGIALSALYLFGRRSVAGILAGALAANVWNGLPWHLAAGIAVGNTLAPVAAWAVLRRLKVSAAFERARDVVVFLAVVSASMLVSATGGTAVLHAGGRLGGVVATWVVWWTGDVMGVVILTPLVLTLTTLCFRRTRETVALLVAAAALTTVAWRTELPARHLVLLLAVWAGLRLGPTGAAAVSFIIASCSIAAVVAGAPAAAPEPQLVLLLTLNGMVTITALSLAATMSERDRAEAALRAANVGLAEKVQQQTAGLSEANARLRSAIERQRSATDALRASERRLRQAQQLARIGSFEWDAAADRNDWSQELYRIYGLPLTGPAPSFEEYLAFVRPDQRDAVRERVEGAVVTGTPLEHQYAVVLADGTDKWVYAYVEPVVRDGELVALHGTCQDITERKRAQDSALEREREAADHLRQLDRAKSDFLSAVSHELRTPLTGIMGFAELLADEQMRKNDEAMTVLVERLGSSATQLNALLLDLLDVDRLQRGIMDSHRSPTLLRDLIDRALAPLSLGKHAVRVEVDDRLADVDPAQTERIVENLVSNALKYTPAGSAIRVQARVDETGGAEIVVEDEGPGIPERLREAIFEPFVRGETGSFTPGTGIGLALVERFARLHGGSAWVEESAGGGAAFHVRLPAARAAA